MFSPDAVILGLTTCTYQQQGNRFFSKYFPSVVEAVDTEPPRYGESTL